MFPPWRCKLQHFFKLLLILTSVTKRRNTLRGKCYLLSSTYISSQITTIGSSLCDWCGWEHIPVPILLCHSSSVVPLCCWSRLFPDFPYYFVERMDTNCAVNLPQNLCTSATSVEICWISNQRNVNVVIGANLRPLVRARSNGHACIARWHLFLFFPWMKNESTVVCHTPWSLVRSWAHITDFAEFHIFIFFMSIWVSSRFFGFLTSPKNMPVGGLVNLN